MNLRKPTVALHYRLRADGFYCAARDLEVLDHSMYAAAIGLLSVHASIALADALLVAAQGERTKGDNHGESARRLRAWGSSNGCSESGTKHFEWLLNKKTRFSYDEQFVDRGELLNAKVKLDQFFAWASSSFPEVVNLKETVDA